MSRRQKSGNKYTRLLSNTMLFGISTFSSKVLSFALTRLYTTVLAEASYGVVDLVTACANLLIPLVSLGISNAVIRFGLEKKVSKEGVFTSGIMAIGMGFGVLVLLYPLLSRIPLVAEHVNLLYLYVLISCLRTLCCQFVRARMYTRLYAIDGILSTAYTVGFNILFLVVWKMGSTGYLLSIICADALSTLGLCLVAVLPQYIKFKNFNWKLLRAMLRYSLPLVPALMFWWVTNASDRFFISYMCGPAENGLYAAAYKVPSIVSIMSTIFTEAWQLSAVTDGQSEDRDKFFTNIFQALAGVAFIAGGGLIYFCQVIMKILVAKSYFDAWQYIPFLVLATVFSALAAFLNSVYMVERKSGLSLATMSIGAGLNLLLNWWLIPIMGPNGAAFATFISYVVVFVIRMFSTRRFVRIRFAPVRLLFSTLLLMLMSLVMLWQGTLWVLWCGLLLAAVVVINFTALYRGLISLVRKRRRAE